MEMKGTPRGKRTARRLRREMSLPEVLLWQQLRQKLDGHQFRRQHPAANFVLDFYCAPARLCIEVDGESHERGSRPEHDAARDAWLAEQGVRVIRIPAAEILKNLEGVMAHIAEELKARR